MYNAYIVLVVISHIGILYIVTICYAFTIYIHNNFMLEREQKHSEDLIYS